MEPDELPPFDDDFSDEASTEERRQVRSRRLARLGRRIMDRGNELGKGVLETSDRAKSEAVRMLAREVRNYLDELRLKEDLIALATSHSLELSLSLSLKPLAHAMAEDSDEVPEPIDPAPVDPEPEWPEESAVSEEVDDPDLVDEPDTTPL